jgi:nitrogen fixation protein FixH
MTFRLHYGIAVAVFYTIFATATVAFVAFAMTQDVQLVSRDYYQRGLQHDGQMQARANAEALGDGVTVALEPAHRRVMIRWPATMARRVRGAATWYRPSDVASDREQPLVVAADGTFALAIDGLSRGVWRLQLRWRVDDTPYYTERVVLLP